MWSLVDLRRPEENNTPYIILESLDSGKNSSRVVHIIKIIEGKTSFQMGRGTECDLRVNDISVSRKHARIEYRHNKFYIVDCKSKFGTVVLQSKNIELSNKKLSTYQIGRTIISVMPIDPIEDQNSNNKKFEVTKENDSKSELCNLASFWNSYTNSFKSIDIDWEEFIVKEQSQIDEECKWKSFILLFTKHA